MTGQQQTPFVIHRDASKEARRRHFDEHYDRIEFEPVAFDLDRVSLALFKSTYRSPIMLLFPKENARRASLVSDIAMTVELAHAMYSEDEDKEDRPVVAYETPEWYLGGMACFTDGSGTSRTAPMHVILHDDEQGEPERAVVQIVCDPRLLTVCE